MYKMLVMDMDGTLLTNDKKISDRNKKAIKDAANRGVKIAISTGRIFVSARAYGRMVGVDAPIIASNGAYIREKDNDEVIYSKSLDNKNIAQILKICREYGVYCHLYTWNTIFTEKLIYSSLNYSKWNEFFPEDERVKIMIIDKSDWEKVIEENKGSILKSLISCEDTDKLKAIREKVSELEVEVTTSNPNVIEIMDKGITKGEAVKKLAEFYNISRDEIICIGDSENDISMIEYAGLGIAMGNAIDDVKKVAKFITLSNEDDGVAYAIEKFLISK